MAVRFKGAHFPRDIILLGGRGQVAYPLSYRHVEELMEERGVSVDHATIQRWVVKYSPPAVAAYLLHCNGIIGEQEVMDATTLPLVRMPNRDGFVPDPRPDVGQASK